MVEEKKYDEKSCGIVLFREQEAEGQGESDGHKQAETPPQTERHYLLLHYPSGHWDLAKGHVENNETELETAARELEEETGISKIKFVEGYREPIYYTYNLKGRPSTKLVVFFLAQTSKKEIQISHEHRNFIWLNYEDSVKKLTFENAKGLVRKAESFLSQ